jgi:hypothetical protein
MVRLRYLWFMDRAPQSSGKWRPGTCFTSRIFCYLCTINTLLRNIDSDSHMPHYDHSLPITPLQSPSGSTRRNEWHWRAWAKAENTDLIQGGSPLQRKGYAFLSGKRPKRPYFKGFVCQEWQWFVDCHSKFYINVYGSSPGLNRPFASALIYLAEIYNVNPVHGIGRKSRTWIEFGLAAGPGSENRPITHFAVGWARGTTANYYCYWSRSFMDCHCWGECRFPHLSILIIN